MCGGQHNSTTAAESLLIPSSEHEPNPFSEAGGEGFGSPQSANRNPFSLSLLSHSSWSAFLHLPWHAHVYIDVCGKNRLWPHVRALVHPEPPSCHQSQHVCQNVTGIGFGDTAAMGFGVPEHPLDTPRTPAGFETLEKFWVVSCRLQNVMFPFREGVTGTLPHLLKLLSPWLLPRSHLLTSLLRELLGQRKQYRWDCSLVCIAHAKGGVKLEAVPKEWAQYTLERQPLRKKTTVTSRCLPTNKAGMKSRRNPTFC